MASMREAVKRLEQLAWSRSATATPCACATGATDGGLDVAAHLLFRAGGARSRACSPALLEARRLMLRRGGAARGAATLGRAGGPPPRAGRSPGGRARRPRGAGTRPGVHEPIVDASGNVVFVLILNSIRQLYLDRAELFRAVVGEPDELARLYRRAGEAIAARSPGARGAGGGGARARAGAAAAGGARVRPHTGLTPREASIFACLCDTVVAPEPLLARGPRHGCRALVRATARRVARGSIRSACARCSTSSSLHRG